MIEKNPETNYESIINWLEIYYSTNDSSIKAQVKANIVAEMVPIIRHIARTIARRAYDPLEDLIQAGFVGLLKAIETYSKDKNDNFKVYAGYFIIGEMKHFLRDKLNTIRVPRHIHELSIRINNFTKNLTYEEIQQLTSDDVAYALNIKTKDVDFILEIDRRTSVLSLEDLYNTQRESLSYEELIVSKGYKEKASTEDARIMFEGLITMLPPDLSVLIDMYYYQDMSQKEIAEALNISKMKVSRDMKRAFKLLYELIEQKALQDS